MTENTRELLIRAYRKTLPDKFKRVYYPYGPEWLSARALYRRGMTQRAPGGFRLSRKGLSCGRTLAGGPVPT